MRIENDVKLDFCDVLIRPKRSTLSSRKEVSLERTYQFKHSGATWTGVPIMAANMDGVGTFEMAVALSNYNMITCLVKSYNLDDFENNNTLSLFFTYSTAVSTGTSDRDFQKLEMINNMYPDMVQFICIDVANGYSEHFGNFVARVRKLYPTKTIIAGNVVTADMTQELILRGADIVKVGIGPGCFPPGQQVRTITGLKNIEDITAGEQVLSHTGQYKTVTNTFTFTDKNSLVNINNIKATPNHEFYVLNKKYKEVATDDNIHEYAEWIPAGELSKDFLLIKHK
jgi:guanosine monophosphate reductase